MVDDEMKSRLIDDINEINFKVSFLHDMLEEDENISEKQWAKIDDIIMNVYLRTENLKENIYFL